MMSCLKRSGAFRVGKRCFLSREAVLFEAKRAVSLSSFCCLSTKVTIISDGQIGNDAADEGDGEEAQAEPCGDDAGHEGEQSGPWGGGGAHHVGEGHDGQGDIGHVVEEAAHEAVPDGSLDEGDGQDADQVGDHDGQQDIDDDAMLAHGLRG